MHQFCMLFKDHASLKTCNVRPFKPPWFSAAVGSAIRLRNGAYRNWKYYPYACNLETFRRCRNRVHNVTPCTKRNCYFEKSDAALPFKGLSKDLREISIRKAP